METEKLNESGRIAYVEGLRRYQDRGVRVLIDGEEANEAHWHKIFEVREDGGFYMGDYILETEDADRARSPGRTGAFTAAGGKLREIRFDIVHNW